MVKMISLSSRFSSILAVFLLWCGAAMANNNFIKMGYNFVTVEQNIVFNSAMQAGGTLNFSAQVSDGGGRNPGDPFTMRMVFYNSSNQIVSTTQQTWTLVLGAAPATYSITATNCGGSCTNVAYVNVEFYGKDGGYWAGNYGPYIQTPSLTFNGGSNILYNPSFGIYSGNTAHGWTSSNGWQSCALYSGTNTCVTNNGATVNGGNYDATGGTTSGTAGGYGAVVVPAVVITTNQSTRKSTAQGTTGSGVYIDQIGDNLTLNVEQHGTGNFIRGKNWTGNASIDGDNNTVNLQQGTANQPSHNNGIGLGITGDSNTVTMRQDSLGFGSGGHRALLDLTGNLNSVIMMQDNTGSGGHYQDVVVVGSSNDLTLQQQNNVAKDLFTTITGSNNTVSVLQKDSGQHYLDVVLGGNGHSVGVTQQGSGNHAARIELNNGGGSSTVNLTQQGGTSQNYTLTQTCTNANGCATSVTQQ